MTPIRSPFVSIKGAVAAADRSRVGRSRPLSRRGLRRRTIRIALRRSSVLEPRIARFWLGALIVGLGILSPILGVAWLPAAVFVVPLLGSALLLPRRSVIAMVALTLAALGYDVGRLGMRTLRPGELVVVGLVAVVAYQLAATRERLGVQGLRGEAMLVDLRDRLRRLGELPALPAGWHAEASVRSAGPTSFGGDFLVAALTGDGSRLEVVLVDVSGKGVDAATRALSLAGAFGGLLGAVAPDRFLSAANAYLLRQSWPEGFATAVHLALDVHTGAYTVRSAGHPPAVHFRSGSGTWQLADAAGAILGVLPGPEFAPVHGTLEPGDAILLYTDGLVETPEREISVGIDKLLGEAERLVTRGFRGGTEWLLETVAPAGSDDQALIIIWRD